jgi:hypothetical protein
MKPILDRCGVRIVVAGLLVLVAGGALACDDGTAIHAAGEVGGGSPGAMQRAGIGPSGVAGAPLPWSRAPASASSVAAVRLDARALRGGVHAMPIDVASQEAKLPEAD